MARGTITYRKQQPPVWPGIDIRPCISVFMSAPVMISLLGHRNSKQAAFNTLSFDVGLYFGPDINSP